MENLGPLLISQTLATVQIWNPLSQEGPGVSEEGPCKIATSMYGDS